jgi:hypothetical protein
VLSADKDTEDERMQLRNEGGEARRNRLIAEAEKRLERRLNPRVVLDSHYGGYLSCRRAEDAVIN